MEGEVIKDQPEWRQGDIRFMKRALELAERAAGRTSPNPMVGAVIVKEGRVIGEGWHHRAGEPHAEIEALRSATEDVRDATVYVSLEPCCHFGRTPPCTKALIDAGITRVFYATSDEDPRTKGEGHKELEAAGLEVVRGPLEEEARHLNRAFFHFMTAKRPYVIAKYAMSLDGRIATHTGNSHWITGLESRAETHRLRDNCDALLVGAGTAIADDPELVVSLEEHDGRQPLRVVLDSTGRVPLKAKLFDASLPGKTVLATTSAMDVYHRSELVSKGVEVWEIAPTENGEISLIPLLERLTQHDVLSLMVEGGAITLGSFFAEHLINEVWAFVGAKLIGGSGAPGPIGSTGIARLEQSPPLDVYETERLESDVLIKAKVV
ncbi:bifunctional diaminohydroxyphosphoribosylaminopyrimidine deaminase/5-amino-6-(5-phosphoribosylamino)uracil reductase RibD [Sulfidibacter corallicola]|uniref:Riboflavin biosynthesis protein RibD n=1 Tax=Sulfidibacter corallicola TaxID=2818388 RepID=A0A8A4TK80_SULCO|nr:bifunctional diaminohydroxyphosphoribosylaminopyrimidine deaminase/5-amino-6-(5-phosphoribosylamino)uracil reductase RibD [Sulfidibacter corallicola]QTD49281.1 bifunctional diaminohydroxyphosphoribosylaminopyrimidine deaminase/5-amino-6-(5-phosphoribosylamino)uracil reductase RibD [Sulfidibacter corallicola]